MTNIQCQPEKSIEFLQTFSPIHLWSLSAIYPKGILGLSDREANIHTKTFLPENYEECKKWIEAMNSKGWNIYFSINPPKKLLNKKAKKEDIAEIGWLYVDIDPRAGEPLEKEQARIRGLLTTNLPAGIPKPTFVINSGGGMWGLWKLSMPYILVAPGDIPTAAITNAFSIEAEARALNLERAFGADACRNIDRICRLPGTINYPDKSKLEKGRQPALAELIEGDPERQYARIEFPFVKDIHGHNVIDLAPVKDLKSDSDREIPLNDINDLDQWRVSERIKQIVLYGKVVDE